VSLLGAQGDGAIQVLVLASIVGPLLVLGLLCWIFWRHRHDD
jgi:hypothetical protein